MAIRLLLCSLLSTLTLALNTSESLDISALLSRFQVGYDRRVRPNYGGAPVTVGVSLYVLSLSEISEKFMDFTFDMYFRLEGVFYHSLNIGFSRQFWRDDRLTFDPKVINTHYIRPFLFSFSAFAFLVDMHSTCIAMKFLTNALLASL